MSAAAIVKKRNRPGKRQSTRAEKKRRRPKESIRNLALTEKLERLRGELATWIVRAKNMRDALEMSKRIMDKFSVRQFSLEGAMRGYSDSRSNLAAYLHIDAMLRDFDGDGGQQ